MKLRAVVFGHGQLFEFRTLVDPVLIEHRLKLSNPIFLNSFYVHELSKDHGV